MYLSVSTQVGENSSGLAILVHRVAGLQLLERHLSPDDRAIVLRIKSGEVTLKLVNVYLKSGSAAYELRPTLLWIQSHLCLHQMDQLTIGGDFQHNPGFHPGFPCSAPSITRAFQEILPDSVSPARPTTAEPTWVSAQGHVGALDHVIYSLPATITSCIDITFPSDHIPQLARFQSVHPVSPLPAIHSKGRYLLPKTPGTRTVQQFQEAFGQLKPIWRTQPLGVAIQYFSKAILQAVQTVAGPPANYLDRPNAVVQIQQHLNHKVVQYPH